MQTRLQRIWLVGAVVILGCDARVGEDYRGEPLLSMSGKLVFENPRVPDGLVPALAFVDATGPASWQFLDVDVRGEFPANFTLDVMLPPPAAAMRAVAGVPSFALAIVSAVPADHGPALTLPAESDGAGSFSWCENSDNTDCYRTIEQCVKGTDTCYRERARCKYVPIENSDSSYEVCNEILEQSGDPAIAFPFASFAGVSASYVLLYVAGETPAGASREYLLDEWSGGGVPYGAFGKNAVPAGYHLIQTREQTAQEQATNDACADTAERESYASFNAKHGTNYTPENEFEDWPDLEDPLYKELAGLRLEAFWEAGCGNGLIYKRLDPASAPIEVTIGTRDLRFAGW
jgi:hypothetical protein